ncbi:MAG: trypsin-like peptidase domain-containing protein [Eubacteriales bacterium]|nr:trypsin-like peptidase domain-containing protein [Eubacteriales bacterium]
MEYRNWYEEEQGQHSAASKKQKRSVSVMTLIACMLVTSLAGGAIGGVITNQAVARNAELQAQAPVIQEQAATPNNLPEAQTPSSGVVMATTASNADAFNKAQIIEKCAPSIVGIDVEGQSVDIFGQTSTSVASGSGIVITADGYIITNAHVVSGAQKFTVHLWDDTQYDATLVGSDSKTDLAVIKVDAENLTPAVLGDSDSLVVGEDVVVMGNPLGELRGTATSGMVSALSRTITIEGEEMTLLQTDAAINPGNSGGGMFDTSGRLIGIVNAKVASSYTEGLGFAIPVNDAKSVIADLMDLGYVSGRAYLGVYTRNVAIQTPGVDGRSDYGSMDDFFGFFGFNGGPQQSSMETRVQVAQVVAASAAEVAGIQADDLILKVDDTEITTGAELSDAISEYNAGDVAKITIQRDGTEQVLQVTFGEYIPA